MKCLRCGPLIKAIDAYLAKAENDLYEQLTMEGYLKAKESLNTVDEIEEVVTKLLEDNADDLLKELADAIDLETFFKDNWPKFKNKSKRSQDLFEVFHTQFSTIMPTYVEAYVQKTDAELTVTKLTKRTTDWISSWSSDLADIMKLDTETEIEAVLKKGLNDGKGINDVANIIADSDIRSLCAARKLHPEPGRRGEDVETHRSIPERPETEPCGYGRRSRPKRAAVHPDWS